MKLPEDWIAVETDHVSSLLDELKKEVAPGHKLFNAQLTVVAYKDGTDDILCRYDNDPDRYCLVHLTWLGKQESNTVFPFVEFDGGFDSFLAFDSAGRIE